jgi:hypothetical protein
MSQDLDSLLSGARALDGDWSSARAARIRGMALRTQSFRARRARTMSRVLVGGTSAACLVLALLRVAASAPSSGPSSGLGVASHPSANEADYLAARALDDGGYTRD